MGPCNGPYGAPIFQAQILYYGVCTPMAAFLDAKLNCSGSSHAQDITTTCIGTLIGTRDPILNSELARGFVWAAALQVLVQL